MVSADVMNNMDFTADPCEDYYEFACSGFANDPMNPQDLPAWGTTRELDKRNQVYLKRVYIGIICLIYNLQC